MKHSNCLAGAASLSFLLLLLLPNLLQAQLGAGTDYVVQKMTKKHGGLERWRAVPSVQFRTHIHDEIYQMPEYYEHVAVHPTQRKAYVDFTNPLGNQAKGQIAYNGRQAWSIGKREGLAAAPPKLIAWRNFFLFNIPFVIHDEGVKTTFDGLGTLPELDDQEFIKVRMTFDPGTGDTPRDYYLLYIDSQSHQLQALEYDMTYASMDKQPVSLLIFDEYERVEGFLMPTRYRIFYKKNRKLVMTGQIWDWHFSKAFDKRRMLMPAWAKPDKSLPEAVDN